MMKKLMSSIFTFILVVLYAAVAWAGDGDSGGWFSGALGAVASGAGGGIIGGVLGLGKKWMADKHEAKMVKEQRLEAAAERTHDLALAEKEIERDMQAAENKLSQAMFEADASALTTASASQDAEVDGLAPALEGSYKWIKSFAGFIFTIVTFTQKMIRPALTIALVWQTFEMLDVLNTSLGGLNQLSVLDQTEIFKRIVYSILSLTGIAVGFWFVARPEKSNRA